ncbi:hypothetical protein EK21DRAFT_67372, partial [Setomelanomma holmii]
QLPHLEPRQLKPPVAPLELPQRAFVDTLTEDDGKAAETEEERVLVAKVIKDCKPKD